MNLFNNSKKPFFIAEVSSNHAQDLERCIEFVNVSKEIGCDAVKFQFFRIDYSFRTKILRPSCSITQAPFRKILVSKPLSHL